MTRDEDKILEEYEAEMADELPKRKLSREEYIKFGNQIESKYLTLLRKGKLKKKAVKAPKSALSSVPPPPPPGKPPPKKSVSKAKDKADKTAKADKKPQSGNKYSTNTLLARDKLLKKIRRGATREKGQLKRLDALTKKNEPKKVDKGNTPQYQKLLDRAKKKKKAKRELKPDSPKTARKSALGILGESKKAYNDKSFKQ